MEMKYYVNKLMGIIYMMVINIDVNHLDLCNNCV